MKRVFRLLFLLIALIPSLIYAEIRDIELEKQSNLEYSMIDYMGDYFFASNYNYKDSKNSYAAYDLEGNIIYKNEYDNIIVTADKDYVYTGTTEDKIVFNFKKYDKKTGKKVNEIVVDAKVTREFINVVVTEDKLIFQGLWGKYNYFSVNKDFSGYEILSDNSIRYPAANYTIEKNGVVSDENFEKIKEYLKNNDFLEKEIHLNYAIEHNNVYYVIIRKEGDISSIVAISKDFKEHKIFVITNDKISKLYNPYVKEMYLVNDKIAVIINSNHGCPSNNIVEEVEHIGDMCRDNKVLQLYNYIYNIETKTDGNGEITTSTDVEYSGKEITFTIKPNEGYELNEVKVIDSLGNVVVFTENKFTMPSADVIVEASFVPKKVEQEKEEVKEEVKEEKNPETYDNMLINVILLILSISLVATLSIKYKKLC